MVDDSDQLKVHPSQLLLLLHSEISAAAFFACLVILRKSAEPLDLSPEHRRTSDFHPTLTLSTQNTYFTAFKMLF